MPQPGHPDKPDAFWYELKSRLLAEYGMDPVAIPGPVLRIFKDYVQAFRARLGDQKQWTREEVWELVRDHFYGHPRA